MTEAIDDPGADADNPSATPAPDSVPDGPAVSAAAVASGAEDERPSAAGVDNAAARSASRSGRQARRGGASGGGRPRNRSARHRAREFAMQGVYQWLLSREDLGVIQAHIERSPEFARADRPHFELLLRAVIRQAPALEAEIVPHLDRELPLLSPVERSILLIACVELRDLQEIPYRVVINEAVDLAKDFGGTDGYKFVNGVLDRLAAGLRPIEAGNARR